MVRDAVVCASSGRPTTEPAVVIKFVGLVGELCCEYRNEAQGEQAQCGSGEGALLSMKLASPVLGHGQAI